MAITNNPLDQYVTSKPGSWPRDFKLPAMPRLAQSLHPGKSLTDALADYDGKVEAWRKQAEQSLSERMRDKEATTTTVTTPPAATPPTSPDVPDVDTDLVTSVNGQIGDVVLTTDDIAEGLVNFYLTEIRWLDYFDRLGFHQNVIAADEAVLIPTDRNLVMYGPLTVEGRLMIDGHFINVTP